MITPIVTAIPFFDIPSKKVAKKFLSFNFEISSSLETSLSI